MTSEEQALNSVTPEDLKDYAEHVAEYLELYEDCMVIPKDYPKMDKKTVKWAVKKVKELIKRLRKGDMDVFEDPSGFAGYIRHTNDMPF